MEAVIFMFLIALALLQAVEIHRLQQRVQALEAREDRRLHQVVRSATSVSQSMPGAGKVVLVPRHSPPDQPV